MLQKILVPLDGSDLAEQALEIALNIGQKSGAQLVLLRVLESEDILIPDHLAMPLPIPQQWVEDFRKKAKFYLDDVVKFYAESGVELQTLILEGDPAAVIVDTAREEEFDLVIMSAHGYSGLQRWILGSVTEKVLRHAACPVLVIRSRDPLESMVIALDGSPTSETVLPISLELARMLKLKVTLLRSEPGLIVQNMGDIEQIERLDPGMGRRIIEELHHRVEHYLEDIKIRFGGEDLEIEIFSTQGEPAGEIMRVGKRRDNAVIAMSTHGREGLRRWLYGSVTEKVLRHSDRHMLVVRPPEF